MMIRVAGGPGLVSPLDYAERKRPLPKTAWLAIGVVAAAHVGVGVALYYQRIESPAPPIVDPLPPTEITLYNPPPPKPPEPMRAEQPAPPPPIHVPTTVTQPVETLPFTPPETPTAPGEQTRVINFDPPPNPAPSGTAPTPTPPAPRLITNVSWSRQPTGEQMTRAYPSRALDAGLAGSVTMNCLVQSDGYVTDCRVSRETPEGQGFARAAQSLTRYFRINPRTVDGVAEGSRVQIGLRFQPPAD